VVAVAPGDPSVVGSQAKPALKVPLVFRYALSELRRMATRTAETPTLSVACPATWTVPRGTPWLAAGLDTVASGAVVSIELLTVKVTNGWVPSTLPAASLARTWIWYVPTAGGVNDRDQVVDVAPGAPSVVGSHANPALKAPLLLR
jgi:hypothetical protein